MNELVTNFILKKNLCREDVLISPLKKKDISKPYWILFRSHIYTQ